jgi:hypothetical protein
MEQPVIQVLQALQALMEQQVIQVLQALMEQQALQVLLE